ncbi:MAG: Hsp70 family protein [Holosporaceae bacterium]|nr:Hsp70 family protein [Holosporaceae bacterium]
MTAVGIDLGTTMSVVSHMEDNVPKILDFDGKSTLPSVVNYSQGTPVVGRQAIYMVDADNTVFSVKRSMGTAARFFGKSAVEVSADILRHIKYVVRQKLGWEVEEAVITVPAHFSDLQRVATQQAAAIANINVLRLINEPTAAAIAFGLHERTNGVFAVYDFGGGTFDFSVLRLADGVFQVLATGGDNHLGGDDVDNEILNHNLRAAGLETNVMGENEKILGKLVAKILKEQLEDNAEVTRGCCLKRGELELRLSSEILEDIMEDFLERTFRISDQTLRNAGVSAKNLDGLVLVGGMTKLNLIQESLAAHFGTKIFHDINPEEAVAKGAAIYANSLLTRRSNTDRNSKNFAAAPLLIDVVPLSLGVETFGGGVDRIIHRNSPIPIMERREYTTYQNNQTGMEFHLVQGERPIADECRSLARFELGNIPPMPAGMARVIVEFSVNVDGLLGVKAWEKSADVTQFITVSPSSGLSGDEMASMLETAAANITADSLAASNIDIKVESERMMKFWETIVDKIPEEAKNIAKARMGQLKDLLEAEKYQDAVAVKNELERIFGQFLDEIISSRLSGENVKNIMAR